MDLKQTGRCDVAWIYLAQDWNRCHGLVKTVMKFGFHRRLECSWPLGDHDITEVQTQFLLTLLKLEFI
jgi:hypothetical protein